MFYVRQWQLKNVYLSIYTIRVLLLIKISILIVVGLKKKISDLGITI